MAESQPGQGPDAPEGEPVPDLDERQLLELTELVYKLMREEIILSSERSGQRPIRR
jgi:hypothetical protein